MGRSRAGWGRKQLLGEKREERERKEEKEKEKKEGGALVRSSSPKQVEVPTKAHPRTRYVAEEAGGAGGVSLPRAAGLGVLSV